MTRRFAGDRFLLSGRAPVSDRLIEQPYPIELDAERYKGAWVVTESGTMHYSNGEIWLAAGPPRIELFLPPWATVPEGWFDTGLTPPAPLDDRRIVTNVFDYNYVLAKMVGRYRADVEDMWIDAVQSELVDAPGDFIGYVRDLSDAGNFASQPVGADRPIFGLNGPLGFFDFDDESKRLIATLQAPAAGSFVLAHNLGVFSGGYTSTGKTDSTDLELPFGQEVGRVSVIDYEWYQIFFFDSSLSQIELDGLRDLLVADEGYPASGIEAAVDIRGMFAGQQWMTAAPLMDTGSAENISDMFSGCLNLQTVPLYNFSSVTSATNSFRGCEALDPIPAFDLSSAVNISGMFRECSSAVAFPLISLPLVETASRTWAGMTALAVFPVIDMPACTNFLEAWAECTSITDFPAIDVAAGENFRRAWAECGNLRTFPSLNFSAAATDFEEAWYLCATLGSEAALAVPAGLFDNVSATNFARAFRGCALKEAEVDNILVSIAAAATSQSLDNGTLDIDLGTSAAPSATGLAAKATLEGRGWTVTHN